VIASAERVEVDEVGIEFMVSQNPEGGF